MVTCMCQLDWARRNGAQIFGQILFWVFLNEINISVGRLDKADWPSRCWWASFNQVKVRMEGKRPTLSWTRQRSSCLTALELWQLVSCLCTCTEISGLPGFQAYQPSDWSYIISYPSSQAFRPRITHHLSLSLSTHTSTHTYLFTYIYIYLILLILFLCRTLTKYRWEVLEKMKIIGRLYPDNKEWFRAWRTRN